jgi:hypothetical protein
MRVLLLIGASALLMGAGYWEEGQEYKDTRPRHYDPMSLEEQQRMIMRQIQNDQLRRDIDWDAKRREDNRRRYEDSQHMLREGERLLRERGY